MYNQKSGMYLEDLKIVALDNVMLIDSSNSTESRIFPYSSFRTKETCRTVYRQMERIFWRSNLNLRASISFDDFYAAIIDRMAQKELERNSNQ